MQQKITILSINADLYPMYYQLVQSSKWGNPMLPIMYNNKLWGCVVCAGNTIIGGWVGILRGDIPLARILTKSVYFDAYPIFINKQHEKEYLDTLIDAITTQAQKDRIVMINLTHWVREQNMEVDQQEKNATFITPLQTTETDLWAKVESKQRNCIRKGEKSGVEVIVSKGTDSLSYLDAFQLLRQRTQQHAIKNNAQASMLLKSNMFFSELFQNPNSTLLVAKVEDKVAAVALMLQSGNTVYYYSGGSDYELNKKYSCSAYLIWKAILYFNEQGIRWFDMGGVPVQPTKEHPAYGVYAFKRSFGGDYQECEGGKIVINNWKYNILKLILSQQKILRLFSKKL